MSADLGATVDYLSSGADRDPQLVGQFSPVVNAVRWIIPDLSRLDWRPWPLYGLAPDAVAVGLAVMMALAYIAIALSIGILVFSRREFS